jgi:ATP-binding cassette subfamily C (CFTR/MRP) protein 4
VMTDWWISDWTECDENGVNSTQSTCNLTNNQRIGLYALFVGSVWVTSLLRSFLFYILALRSARVLHDRMFTSVLRSPMLFFDTNPIGGFPSHDLCLI